MVIFLLITFLCFINISCLPEYGIKWNIVEIQEKIQYIYIYVVNTKIDVNLWQILVNCCTFWCRSVKKWKLALFVDSRRNVGLRGREFREGKVDIRSGLGIVLPVLMVWQTPLNFIFCYIKPERYVIKYVTWCPRWTYNPRHQNERFSMSLNLSFIIYHIYVTSD